MFTLITAILFALIGLALGFGGIKLALLGGSIYYIITAIGFLLTAYLLLSVAQRHYGSMLWLF